MHFSDRNLTLSKSTMCRRFPAAFAERDTRSMLGLLQCFYCFQHYVLACKEKFEDARRRKESQMIQALSTVHPQSLRMPMCPVLHVNAATGRGALTPSPNCHTRDPNAVGESRSSHSPPPIVIMIMAAVAPVPAS